MSITAASVDGVWDNARWADALAAHFFSAEMVGEPVTFAVEPDALSVIAELTPDDAVESLAGAVRALVMPGHRFVKVAQLATAWQQAGCPAAPPSLPLLGLTVLAFSTSDRFALYKPLRRLLDPLDNRGGIPAGYDDVVPDLWEQLRWWLEVDQAGRRGLPTITKHEFYVNIGYSTQQSLLRASDRPLLYRFFRAVGLQPQQEVIIASELRRALEIWAKRRLPRAARLHRLATDVGVEAYADALLQTLAAKWDGRLRDSTTGSHAAVLRLVLELRPVALSFVARRRQKDPAEVQVEVPGAGRLHLAADGAHFAPLPLPVPVTSVALSDGLDLTGPDLSFFHEPVQAIPFAYDGELLEWVSVDRITFDEKHHLLVARDIRESTLQWLDQEGFGGRLDPAATRHLPEGWFLIRDVRINRRTSTHGPRDVQDLLGSSGGGERLRLVGGLKLKHLDRTYLTGGTPNISVPLGVDPVFCIVKEGAGSIEREARGAEFEMMQFDLDPGDYRVEHGTASFPFTVVEAYREAPPPNVGSVRTHAGGETSLSGLIVDSGGGYACKPVVVPARSREAMVLLGAQAGETAPVTVPCWVEALADGPLSWLSIDAWVPFEPAWLLVRAPEGRASTYTAHPNALSPPSCGVGNGQWARLILASELADGVEASAQEMWREYVQLAAEMAR